MHKTVKTWSGSFRILIGLLAASLLLGSIVSPAVANTAAVISSGTTLEDGDENPSIVLTGTDFKADADLLTTDFNVELNQTGLSFDGVTGDSSSQVTLSFTGVALRGEIQISANPSAFTTTYLQSNTEAVSVNGQTLPACSATPTEVCVNAGSATEISSATTRDIQVQRANASLSGGAFMNLQFYIENSGGGFMKPAAGDIFTGVEILYPTSDAIGADLETSSFAMSAVDDFEFTKTTETISGSAFVKLTFSFATRMTTNKVGCERDGGSFGDGPNSVCEAENGEYINMVTNSVDVFSPGSLENLPTTADGGYLITVGSAFYWGSPSESEPFQFQLVGPKFQPIDRSVENNTTTDPSEVTANSGALKIFLPTAMANQLYGADFNPVLTRKDNVAGSLVTNELSASEGLVITQPTGGYLMEIESLPFSAPVFAVSSEVAESSPAPSVSAAPPVYAGPLITDVSSRVVSAGDVVSISGQRVSGISKASVDGEELEVSNITARGFDITIAAGLEPGSKDLVIESSAGNVTYQDAFEVVVATEEETLVSEAVGWTKKIETTSVKMYAKNIVSAGKVQFIFNGEEIAWVNAEDSTDPKLRIVGDANYLVRTVELVEGMKNILEVYLDGERIRRTAYSR